MRGVKSFAMVLCVCTLLALNSANLLSSIFQATSKGGKDGGIELVKPPENSKIGDRVYFEGPDYESERAFLGHSQRLAFSRAPPVQMQPHCLS